MVIPILARRAHPPPQEVTTVNVGLKMQSDLTLRWKVW